MAVFEAGISKQSRSHFLELDANASKNGPVLTSPRPLSPRIHRNDSGTIIVTNYENVIKSGESIDDIRIQTEDISNKFKFFETYQEPVKPKKEFRITPPRDGQIKVNLIS